MMKEKIDRILNPVEGSQNHSLRSKPLHRDKTGELSRTLTAHEWKPWYAEHSRQKEHKRDLGDTKPASWWKRLASVTGGTVTAIHQGA
jgi:hypothetical protein